MTGDKKNWRTRLVERISATKWAKTNSVPCEYFRGSLDESRRNLAKLGSEAAKVGFNLRPKFELTRRKVFGGGSSLINRQLCLQSI